MNVKDRNKVKVQNSDQTGWTTEASNMPGFYWFYGNPYLGQMGIDFRDNAPPIIPKMDLIEVHPLSTGKIGATEGQFVYLRKFDKSIIKQGYIGYWKQAELPTAPMDYENQFPQKEKI